MTAAVAVQAAGAAKSAKDAKRARKSSSKAHEAGRRDALAGRPPDSSYDGGADEFDYDRGYQAGLDELDGTDAGGSDTSPRARRDGSAGSRRDGSKRKGRTSSKRSKSAATAKRRVAAPVARTTASALTAVGGGVALAIAYNFLTNAEKVGGALDGVARGLRWLEDPTKSIPYRS